VATCQFGDNYLRIVKSGSLSTCIDDALRIIKNNLDSQSDFMKGRPGVTEISQQSAITNPSVGPGRRGTYIPGTNQIIFVRGLWCVSTTLHETLHSVSSIQELQEAIQLMPLFEGLTECLTGYLLYKAYPQVYSDCWRTDKPTACHMSYEAMCRLWGALFHFVPIKVIVPLYLERPPGWSRMCQRFVQSIRESGYMHFGDVLSNVLPGGNVTHETFRNECQRVFGKKFTVFTRTPVALDFSSVRQ
jgi:hypothetical protein